MKRIFLAFLLCGILVGCGHTPKKDIVVKAHTQFGLCLIIIEKGTLDEENRGKVWQYLDELRKEK